MGRKRLNITRLELEKTLESTQYNKSEAARELGCSLTALKQLVKRYDLECVGNVGRPRKEAEKLDSIRLMSYFQQGLKLKEIADLMNCKPYMVRESLIDLLGKKKYNNLKLLYKWHKRENKAVPKEYLLQ